MKNIDLSSHAPVISDTVTGESILNEIKQALQTNDKVSVDMKGVKSMATFCAKQIFGKLYIDLGSDDFFNKIEIKNATDNVKTIIRIAIESTIK